MSQVTHTVSFVGESSQAKVDSGASVLQAARDAGVDIVATCGGRGRCRSCRVKVVEGTLPPQRWPISCSWVIKRCASIIAFPASCG